VFFQIAKLISDAKRTGAQGAPVEAQVESAQGNYGPMPQLARRRNQAAERSFPNQSCDKR
jgi:hypothetical protein